MFLQSRFALLVAAASVVRKWYTDLGFLVIFRVCFRGKCAVCSGVRFPSS